MLRSRRWWLALLTLEVYALVAPVILGFVVALGAYWTGLSQTMSYRSSDDLEGLTAFLVAGLFLACAFRLAHHAGYRLIIARQRPVKAPSPHSSHQRLGEVAPQPIE
jgi:hypothetical protein